LYFNQSYLLKEDRYVFYMGTRIGNLKSKMRRPIEHLFSRKGVLKFPSEIGYDTVFKNHAVLMNAYGTVLKRDSQTFDWFFRSGFIESHIYKKLRLLKKIYLVEIAALYNSDNNTARRLTLNKLVEDIDKFSGCLFYFPTISWREILLYIIPTIAAATAVVYHLRGLFPDSWSPGVNMSAYLTIITALGLTFLVYLVFAAVSFIDKRRFFIFPEYKALRFFDRLKKRYEAFSGGNIEGTIYEKENKLFGSLRMVKEPESPVDIYLFITIIWGIQSILLALSALNEFWLILVFIPFFFLLKRKAV